MRVTRRQTTTIPGVGGLAAPAESAESAAANGTPITDRVQLSEAARLRQRLKAELGDPTAVDVGKVAALGAEVANQTYGPNPRAIADRLLGEIAADLLA
jgi:flagellar biosynthesis anti-sigma factor FlgM